MKIESLLKIGIVAGIIAYGCNKCEKFMDIASEGNDIVRERSKVYVKQMSPRKYDSLMNAGLANDTKAWVDTEIAILDSLNNQSIYNKAFIKTAKDTLKRIK